MRTILVLDMSYTLKMYKERQLERALASRRLDGYFDKVISVHPLAGLFEEGDARFGRPTTTHLDESHDFIEGRIGVSQRLRSIAPLNLLLAQAALMKLLLRVAREVSVDVIRVGDPYYLGLMGLFLARRLRIPLVIRVAARYDDLVSASKQAMFPRLFRFRQIEKAIERFVFRRCDLIAGANEDNMRYALENGGRSDRATVFRYGNLIHPKHWEAPDLRSNSDAELNQLGLCGHRFVATVARLEPMKHVDDTIRVVAELARRGHAVNAVIVGDGALKSDLESFATSLGVKERVIFAGNRTQEWIAKVLPKASAIVSPHMGRALTEAALAAVPIVAYDYDWQREVIIDGHTGYLVPYKDWLQLADKTETLLTNPKIAAQFARNVRLHVLDMMDSDRLTRHEQNEYSKLLRRFTSTWQSDPEFDS